MINETEIAEILTFEEESSSGECCKFIDLENGWGIKCFEDEKGCEVSYTCQKFAAESNLAPKVGKKFNLIDHNGDGWYCHMTEVADTICGYGYQNSQAEYGPDGEDPEDLFRDERDDYLVEFDDKLGYYYHDDHAGNYGFIERDGKRKLVAIDFNLCFTIYNDLTEV
jgi:hypothetical protein